MPVYAVWLTTGNFETRGEVFPRFAGGVTVGAHASWSKLQTLEFSQPRTAGGVPVAPGTSEMVVTKLPDSASPTFFKVCAAGQHVPAERSGIALRIDFTRADGKGGEATELSVTLHGVVMNRDNANPRSGGVSASTERYRLRYRKMTYSNMPASSADVSRAAEAKMRRVLQALG
jgi:type VI protein secretion system component Hcp